MSQPYVLRLMTAAIIACAALFAVQSAHGLEDGLEELTALNRVCSAIKKNGDVQHGCVIKSENEWFFLDPSSQAGLDCVASGTYIDSAQTVSNFGKLRVVTGASHNDVDQAYAAGFLEGYLTAARIYDHHFNLKGYFVSVLNESESLEKSLDWLEGQEEWANAQIAAAPEDPYWQLLGLIQAQFNGLVAGYQARAKAEEQAAGGGHGRRLAGLGKGSGNDDVAVGWLERRDLLFLNSNGDVYDIMDALEAGYAGDDDAAEGGSGDGSASSALQARRKVPRWAEVDPDPVRMALKLGLQGKCSALIKVTGDLGDLLIGHSTHDSFTAMTRIYKHYDFSATANPVLAAKKMSFSSYPGELFSDDDFYLLSSGLVVVETTNHIYRGDVYAPLSRQCVLSWQRLRLANWMAISGEEWVEVFARHNSGTYNNQYMVLDSKRFIPHTELQPGLLWVIEQLPGFFKTQDMTDELSRGYWPSYNVAYFPEVYEAAGYPDMIERLAEEGAKKYAFSIRLLKYQIAPRAAIFRRDQGAVGNLEQLKYLMRYNDWQHDPYADGNPVGAVCARGDLAKGDQALAKGCYDSKVTSFSMLSRLESEVVGGPTAQGQPAFSWSDPRWTGLPHRGMPETFDFAFEKMSPRDLPTWAECSELEDKQQAQQQEMMVEEQAQTEAQQAEGGVAAAEEEAVEQVPFVSVLLPRKAGRGNVAVARRR